MKECFSNFAKTFLLCLCGFFFARLVIFPGFLDMSSPSHDDLYRYYLLSQAQWEMKSWLSPRPLMLLFLHVIGGFFKTPGALWLILALSSVVLVASLIELIKRIFVLTIKPLGVLAYTIIIFSLPSSWEIHQLDYGGMLSGVLCVIAISLFIDLFRKRELVNGWLFVLPLVIYWLAIETKPTFSVLVFVISVLFAAIARNSVSVFTALGVLVISIVVFLKDKYLGSPFVGDEGAGVYEVQIGVSKNIQALIAYVDGAVSLFLLPGLFLVYSALAYKKETRWFVLLSPVFALAAIAPMLLIPNRVLTLYSWYSSMFLLLPLLFLPEFRNFSWEPKAKVLVLIGAIFVVAGQFLFSAKLKPFSSHFYNVSSYNNNVIGSLSWIKDNSPDLSNRRVLVSGLKGPFHPFRQKSFVSEITGFSRYKLLLRISEFQWNEGSKHMGQVVDLNSLKIEEFDTFIVYAPDGKIRYSLTRDWLMGVPAYWREAVIYCAVDQYVSPSDVDEAMACFAHSDEYVAAIRLGSAPGVVEKMGWVGLYHYGASLVKDGKYSQARTYLEKALSMSGHPLVSDALKAIEEKGG